MIDLDAAHRFLEILDPTTDRFTFQTFMDDKSSKDAMILHGTLGECADKLSRLSRAGHGVFVTINETDFMGRDKKNVVGLRYLFVDFDEYPIPAPAVPLSIEVQTVNGRHYYWRLKASERGRVSEGDAAISQIVKFYGSDKGAKGINRVFRIPGFPHQKVRSTPLPILLVQHTDHEYTIDEVLAAHPVVMPAPAAGVGVRKKPKTAADPAASLRKRRASAYLSRIPCAIEGEGGDAQTWDAALKMIVGFDLTEEDGYQLLLSEYNPRCQPPWTEHELRHKAHEAASSSTLTRGFLLNGPDPKVDGKTFPFTDLGNAERFANDHGTSVRYVHQWERWIIWNGNRWQPDKTKTITQFAKETVRGIHKEAKQHSTEKQQLEAIKWAYKSEGNARIEAALALARSEKGLGILPEDLDANTWILNVQNGTIDLKTGAFHEHDPAAMCSMMSNMRFNPKAKAPVWEKFIDRIMGSDTEVIRFLQQIAGYSLTGQTNEQCLFVLHGNGNNGKSVLMSTLRWLLGDYGTQAKAETFADRKPDAQSNDIAALRGARLVVASETAAGASLAEALVKQATGGEPLVARFLHHEFFTFNPTFKLWLSTNHKPVIRGVDHAIWRRIRLIPFNVVIPPEERNRDLDELLKTEAEGILNWMLEGLRSWLKDGLRVPASISSATDDYRDEMDFLGPFFDKYCDLTGQSNEETAAEIYRWYVTWCRMTDEHAMSSRAFGISLGQRGLRREKGTGGARKWRGIKLRGNVFEDAKNSSEKRVN